MRVEGRPCLQVREASPGGSFVRGRICPKRAKSCREDAQPSLSRVSTDCGLRTFHQKSSCLHIISFRAVCGANLVTLPSTFGGPEPWQVLAWTFVALLCADRSLGAPPDPSLEAPKQVGMFGAPLRRLALLSQLQVSHLSLPLLPACPLFLLLRYSQA